jgi:hypothetical protein
LAYPLLPAPATIMLMDSQNQPNFDFIINPETQKGSGRLLNSKKQRIITVVVGIVVLLVVTMVASTVIKSISGKSNDQVLDLVAFQSELKRVIALGNDRSRSADTKNKALTATYTLESDYQQTLKIMNSRSIKAPKDLTARYAGNQSDQALDAAEKANNFDAKYEEIYAEKLTKYKAKLSEVYPSLKPAEQAIVKKQSDNAKALLGETTAETK